MKVFFAALAALALATVAGAPAALAAEPPTRAWGSAWDFPSQDQRQVDMNAAVATEVARQKGYGPGKTTYNTTIEEQTITEIHNGPETTTSTSATNVVNSNSSTTKTQVGANSPGVVVTATNGTSQTSWSATQGATAQGTVSSNSGTTQSTASTAN